VARGVGLPQDFERVGVLAKSSISGWVAENVKPLFVEDIRQEPTVDRLSWQLRDNSFISVPLERKSSALAETNITTNRVIAVLNVTEKTQRRHLL
jgi:hypothetical protein